MRGGQAPLINNKPAKRPAAVAQLWLGSRLSWSSGKAGQLAIQYIKQLKLCLKAGVKNYDSGIFLTLINKNIL